MTPAEVTCRLRQLLLDVGAQPASRFASGAAFDAWGEGEALLFDAIYKLDDALEMPAPTEEEMYLNAVRDAQDAARKEVVS